MVVKKIENAVVIKPKNLKITVIYFSQIGNLYFKKN